MASNKKTMDGQTAEKKEKGRLRAAFSSRTFKAGSYSIAAAAILIAIAVVVNLAVSALPSKYTQIDITSSGLYTLSEQSESIVSGLTEDVTLYWIVQDGQEDTAIRQLLSRYDSLSSKLHVVKKDPVVYPNFASQYTSASISNNCIIVVCGEKSRYIANDDIYAVDYSDYYTSGTYTTSFAGESCITSAISYVVSDTGSTVYALSGHGEVSVPTWLQTSIANENIELLSLSLLSSGSVPEDADCLIVFAPASDISSAEKDMILAYLAGGGSMLLITDYSTEDFTNLFALTAYYGASLYDGVVIEGNQNYHYYEYPYYLIPAIDSHAITDPIADGGYSTVLPVAQGIEILGGARDTLTVSELLSTSSAAYSKIAGYGLTTYDKEDGDISGGFPLAVAITDTLSQDGSDSTEDAAVAHVVWFTTSNMFTSDCNEMSSGANGDLFLNSLAWMIGLEDGITIRAKEITNNYLTVPSASASLLSWVMMGVIPLSCLAVGVVITMKRRKR